MKYIVPSFDFYRYKQLKREEKLKEYCGVFVTNRLTNVYRADLVEDKSISNSDTLHRHTCEIKSGINYFAIRWHTHPNKFYPSIQDLFSLYKNPLRYVEVIYTREGIWVIKKDADFRLKDITKEEYQRYYEYEKILYILSHEKFKSHTLHNCYDQVIEPNGGRYATPLALFFINHQYKDMIENMFELKIEFYKENQVKPEQVKPEQVKPEQVIEIDCDLDQNHPLLTTGMPIKLDKTLTIMGDTNLYPFLLKYYSDEYVIENLDYSFLIENNEDKENQPPFENLPKKSKYEHKLRSTRRSKSRKHRSNQRTRKNRSKSRKNRSIIRNGDEPRKNRSIIRNGAESRSRVKNSKRR